MARHVEHYKRCIPKNEFESKKANKELRVSTFQSSVGRRRLRHAFLRLAPTQWSLLRHVYASLQIEQGVTPKRLQKLIGHATLKMTLYTYGHLWPDEDADRARARGMERLI